MFRSQQSQRIADWPHQRSGRQVRGHHDEWSSGPRSPLPRSLNAKFPMSALAISEAEKPLEKQQQNNEGWEFTVPKLEPPIKGWEGPSNNDKDDPPASVMIPAAANIFMLL